MTEFSPYEERFIEEARRYKSKKPGIVERSMRVVNWPAAKATELAFKVPGVERAVEVSVGELFEFLNDAAQWSVRSESIFEEYRDAGHKVHHLRDIHALDLEQVDKVIGRIDLKYQSIAAGGGIAAGAVGLIGIPADVAAIAAINLRAAGEYATYCGFDIADKVERVYALSLLNVASMESTKTKREAIAELEKIARKMAGDKADDSLERKSFVRIIKAMSKGLIRTLTKQKASQSIPVFGAAMGGGSNFFFTDDVCEAAHILYRERFLALKYGANKIFTLTRPRDGKGNWA